MALTLTQKYRTAFGTPDGREVLTDILDKCGYFSMSAPSTDNLILYNLAKLILANCGVMTINNKSNVVDALMSIPYEDIEKETDIDRL